MNNPNESNMSVVRKIGVTSILVLICMTFGQAQGRNARSPQERAQRQTKIMIEALDLTEAQVPLVDQINLKYSQRATDLWNQDGNRRAKFKTLRKLMSQKDTELEAVLSADQYMIYEEKKADMRARVRKKRKERS